MIYDNLTELDVLTAILTERKEKGKHLVELLGEDDFYNPQYRTVFIESKRMLAENDSVNLSGVFKALDFNGSESLKKEIYDHRTGLKVDVMSSKLIKVRRVRKLQEMSIVLQNKVGLINGKNVIDYTTLDLEIDEIEKGINAELSITPQNSKTIAIDNESIAKYLADLQKRIKENRDGGLMFGIPDIDFKVGGLRPGTLTTIAGRTGTGKSSLAHTAIINQAIAGKKSLIFSLEMGFNQLLNKFIAMSSQQIGDPIPYQALKNPFGKVKDLQNLKSVLDKKTLNDKVFINCEQGLTVETMKSIIRDYKRLHGIDIAYIDQLSLMVKNRLTEREEISHITTNLKQIAMELDIPIVDIAQLNRNATKDFPKLSDLKSSGSIEEDSDTVLLIHRAYAISHKSEKGADINPRTTEIDVAKNRDGDTGIVEVDFDPPTTLFTGIENGEYKIEEHQQVGF